MTPFIVTNWLKSDIQLVSSYHHHLSKAHCTSPTTDPSTDLQPHELAKNPLESLFVAKTISKTLLKTAECQKPFDQDDTGSKTFHSWLKELFFLLCHKTAAQATQKDMNFPS